MIQFYIDLKIIQFYIYLKKIINTIIIVRYPGGNITTLLGRPRPLDGGASSGWERCQKDAKISYVSCSSSCVSISEGVASGSETSGSIPPPSLTVRCLTSVVKLRRCTASPYFVFLFDPIVKTAPMHCLLPPYFFDSLHQTGKTAPLHCLPQRSLFLPILSQWMLEMPGTAHGR